MADPNVTAEQVRELLRYDPDTGDFWWKVRTAQRTKVGGLAGTKSGRYRVLRVAGRTCLAHRVAWLLGTGKWPEKVIDHINGDGHDNRLCNLRDVSQSLNIRSGRKGQNKYGARGVSWDASRNRFRVEMRVDLVRINAGRFATLEEAIAASRAIDPLST